ncbi:MAG TPA: prenyltransferase/squalene oxidase repeat-containing protein, partial [Myxococcales bacterium]
DPRIEAACKLWIERFAKADGGFGADGDKKSHLCVVGNTARALVQFGYGDHPAVRTAFEWMVKNQSHLGGWSCFGSGRNLDSWEPLSAFAVYPRKLWTPAMGQSVERAAEFFLERELSRQGEHYEPWFRLHSPVHYYYDLLVGLEFMTALGYASDPRMKPALTFLESKRRRDGRFVLDAVHPDVEGGMKEWFDKNPKQRPTAFALEEVGKPSKLVTLRALTVLQRALG